LCWGEEAGHNANSKLASSGVDFLLLHERAQIIYRPGMFAVARANHKTRSLQRPTKTSIRHPKGDCNWRKIGHFRARSALWPENNFVLEIVPKFGPTGGSTELLPYKQTVNNGIKVPMKSDRFLAFRGGQRPSNKTTIMNKENCSWFGRRWRIINVTSGRRIMELWQHAHSVFWARRTTAQFFSFVFYLPSLLLP
jgi:hypothetical protein